MTEKKRRSFPRQTNSAAAMPPAAVVCRADTLMIQRKVQKGGAVSIPAFRKGAQVRVATLDAQTVLVSARSATEVEALIQRIPGERPSRFAALSTAFQGRSNEIVKDRRRRGYSSESTVPSISDEQALRQASLQRTTRRR
jgi:hypothetical protein